MARALALAVALMTTACIEDTTASKACGASGSAPECKACCRAHGDRNYTFHVASTTKTCMCELSSSRR